ncbi:MAG: exopolyphosphatase [Acidimicrobiia bacterium]
MSPATRSVAAVDIGTNSTRLLVCDVHGNELERRTIITRLGQGVDAERRLRAEAIDRTCDALREFANIWTAHGVDPTTSVRIIATSASRDASNREQFFDRAEEACGVRPELVSGDAEAALAFVGATVGLHPHDGPFLVVDIGGGSTEFILGSLDPDTRAPSITGSISIDMGSVRLTERELHGDPPRAEELSNAIGFVADHLEDVERAISGIRAHRTLIGVAGTITTVAAVELGLAVYDRSAVHRFRLSRAAAEDVFRTLATESLADRLHNPGLPAARADIIVGGCCILVGIMRWLKADSLLVSETDLLDALARSLSDGLQS